MASNEKTSSVAAKPSLLSECNTTGMPACVSRPRLRGDDNDGRNTTGVDDETRTAERAPVATEVRGRVDERRLHDGSGKVLGEVRRNRERAIARWPLDRRGWTGRDARRPR